jgi:hypothetical protein
LPLMADDVREYVRAAQAAEIQGNKPQAVELLRKAAALYRNQGNNARALQMLRQAGRLDDRSPELEQELRRMEWLPDQAMARAAGTEDDAERAVAVLDEWVRPKELIERGPTLADPGLQAWCSFCCRPRTEVGDLVAGPAGAFICAGCLKESARLMKVPAATTGALPPPPSAPAPSVAFVGQAEAAALVGRALASGVRTLLLVGPSGSGKSAYLADLERRGVGVRLTDLSALSAVSQDAYALVDLEGGEDDEWCRALAGRRVLVAVRGEAPKVSFAVANDELELPIVGTAALVQATGGRLPAAFAERVQLVVPFRRLLPSELEEIARQMLDQRAAELDVSDTVLQHLAAAAVDTDNQGHELRALVARLPPGSWALRALSPAPEPKRRKKGGR